MRALCTWLWTALWERIRGDWTALRERLRRIPADDEQRIIDWIPGGQHRAGPIAIASDIRPVAEREAYSETPYANRVTIPVPREALARTAEATMLADVDEPCPIYDQLVADLAEAQAARLRALRAPTAAFWALVQATDWTCEHCAAGDHLLCPGCECVCTLVGLEAVPA